MQDHHLTPIPLDPPGDIVPCREVDQISLESVGAAALHLRHHVVARQEFVRHL